jgi:hypothetical protein
MLDYKTIQTIVWYFTEAMEGIGTRTFTERIRDAIVFCEQNGKPEEAERLRKILEAI